MSQWWWNSSLTVFLFEWVTDPISINSAVSLSPVFRDNKGSLGKNNYYNYKFICVLLMCMHYSLLALFIWLCGGRATNPVCDIWFSQLVAEMRQERLAGLGATLRLCPHRPSSLTGLLCISLKQCIDAGMCTAPENVRVSSRVSRASWRTLATHYLWKRSGGSGTTSSSHTREWRNAAGWEEAEPRPHGNTMRYGEIIRYNQYLCVTRIQGKAC